MSLNDATYKEFQVEVCKVSLDLGCEFFRKFVNDIP